MSIYDRVFARACGFNKFDARRGQADIVEFIIYLLENIFNVWCDEQRARA